LSSGDYGVLSLRPYILGPELRKHFGDVQAR
jgi:hypothetical protein